MYKQCKTEQSAARQRTIEKGLLSLMHIKPYDEISVSDLCEYMSIPRKSFYRYFSSKEGAFHALLDHTMLEYEGFNAVYASGDHRTLEKELTQFFLFWMEHKDLLDALSRNNLCGFLVERTLSHISTGQVIPLRFLSDETQYARKQISLFCISGLMSIVLTWHSDGYPESAAHLAAITARLVTQPLFPDIQTLL